MNKASSNLTLQEAGVTLIDCVHKTPAAQESGELYIAIPQLHDGRIETNDARRISIEDFEEWTQKAKPKPYDVVLSRRCNPGETAYVPPGLVFALGQNLVLLRADGKKLFPPFLRWLVRTPQWWEQVKKFINVGAVFTSLKCADVPNFTLPIPSLSEQERLASILSDLDDKIHLNQQINQTLEQMAQAMFKSWFVDFEPVKAKIAAKKKGRDPERAAMCALSGKTEAQLDQLTKAKQKQLAQTAALFPGAMVESKLGMIPQGWKIRRLDEVLVLQRGFDLPKSKRKPGPYPVLMASGPSDWHAEAKVKGPGVVTGRSGKLGEVFLILKDFWPLNTTLWIKEYKQSSPCHAYFLLKTFSFDTFNSGSAVPTLNRNHIHNLPVTSAPLSLISAFEATAILMFKKQQRCDHESQKLSEVRDTLLPKLLSGALRIA